MTFGLGVQKNIKFLFPGNEEHTFKFIVLLYEESQVIEQMSSIDWHFELSVRLCFSVINDKLLLRAYFYTKRLKEELFARGKIAETIIGRYFDELTKIVKERDLPTEW